jgi:WD40 repeat protein
MKGQLVQKSIFRQLALALIVLLTTLIASCNPFSEKPASFIQSRELFFPETQFYNALVQTNNALVVLVDGDGDRSDLQFYSAESDEKLMRFDFPPDNSCASARYYGYETFPDSRLQVWKYCLTENGKVTYLMAFDWLTHKLSEVSGSLPLGTSGASWNPGQTTAIGYLDSKFASKTLFWIRPGGYEPLDLEIVDGDRSWNLQDDFPKFTADDTGKTGTTGRASWSPDGKTIAFFASPNAIGKTSFDRFGVEFYLYLMNPETLQYEVVADSLYSPFLLSWSPDSSYIAFIGKYGFRKENGIWLFSTKTNSITEISQGTFHGVVWRPDGNSLVAIKCQSIDVCDQILEYDISSVLK